MTLHWLICTDTGGTFTDCLARDPEGVLHRAKVLSTSALRASIRRVVDESTIEIEQNWRACDDLIAGFALRALDTGEPIGRVVRFDAERSLLKVDGRSRVANQIDRLQPGRLIEAASDEPAPILAARLVTGTPAGSRLPPMHMRLATTSGTNALLERKGAAVALFITEGFADLLHIGDQLRPDIFALRIIKPPLLHEHVVEVHERLNADGTMLRALDEHDVRAAATKLLSEHGVRVAAIALMHGHRNPDHELQVAAVLRECGFEHVSISSEIAPLIRIVPRAQTAVVDAYLGPIISDYLDSVRRAMESADSSGASSSRLHMMTSAGSLNSASRFRACESLLSGPAGGVIGTAAAGRASGFAHVIGFDMGGTSTDVCRCDEELEYRFEHSVGDAKLLAPALAIETVAAGGGSICDFIDGRLIVGPHSAGAQPGPACYGLDGPLTITDVNLLLGRLSADQFEIPISKHAAEAAFDRLLRRIEASSSASPCATDVLGGFLEIANQRMAAAIEQVSLRRGYDVRDYALLAFGGAGGQHACSLAERLGISTIIMPLDASLLSAAGLMAASVERIAQRQVLQSLESCGDDLPGWIQLLEQQARSQVAVEVVAGAKVVIRRVIADIRMLGQDSTIQIEIGEDERDDLIRLIRMRFAMRYEQVYGHPPPLDRKPVEVESIRVLASADDQRPEASKVVGEDATVAMSFRRQRVHVGGDWCELPAFDRESLRSGAFIDGPAIVLDRRSSCLIESGWTARIDSTGAIVAKRNSDRAATGRDGCQPEIVKRELFSHRFMAIATEMGQMLQRTALSTNVKERLDFSCTVLDAEGNLIANAPHLPVHLGAMGVCVRAVRDALVMKPGDVVITNHPAFGGSHLPDITIISPAFDDQQRLIGYVANRAHHAELGGTRPGSMPPDAISLIEEGVVIAPRHLVREGEAQWDSIEHDLQNAQYPSRAVADNVADLHAQVAANNRGVAALRAMALRHGIDEVKWQMKALTERAADLAAQRLDQFPATSLAATERLDDGSQLVVSIDLASRPVVIDFAGTSPQHRGNLNATPAIVRSAVIYVLRLLIGEALPLNEGLLRGIELRVPPGSLLNPIFDLRDPSRCPAVVGGNTEVSQRLVDTLLKAFGTAACSQGTMNNVLFGNERFGYYETVCGGSGATVDGSGASAVHVHMTNTRITDPEVLEHRYPVRLDCFAVRRGSGGDGMYRGGDGAVREMTFLESVSLSVLSQHRVEQPYGIEGGGSGARGRQRVIRATGETVELRSIDGCELHPGDRLVLETPGGGGCGRP